MKKIFSALLFVILSSSVSHAANWYENIKMGGDFRFRTDQIRAEETAPAPDSTRNRQRLRLRLNTTAKVNEDTDVTVRLASGNQTVADTGSTNQTYDDYAAKKGINLDLAYFTYRANEDLQVWGGKSLNPFYFTGGNDLIFDTDLTLEGLAVKYTHTNESLNWYANIGYIWMDERFNAAASKGNSDVMMTGLQLGANYKMGEYFLGLSIADYKYSAAKDATAGAAAGNTVIGGAYANDFNLTSYNAEFGFNIGAIPSSVFVGTSTNTKADLHKNGYIYGLKVNKLKEKGSWAATIDHRLVEKDSVLGALAESDACGGGTDTRCTRVTGSYQWMENSNVGLSVYAGKRAISVASGQDYKRFMLDFNFLF